MQADAVNRGHADRAGDDVLDLLQLVLQRDIARNDLLAVIVQHLALAGQAELLLAPLDQQRFEKTFQRTDLLAHRRLRDVVDLSGFGKAGRFRQITEDFQALNLHKPHEYSVSENASTNVSRPTQCPNLVWFILLKWAFPAIGGAFSMRRSNHNFSLQAFRHVKLWF